MSKLFLDDIRPCPAGWDLAKNYDEFVTYIQTGMPGIISFDHDLADEHYHGMAMGGYNAPYVEKTGHDCARWLVEALQNNAPNCCQIIVPPTLAIIHSFNPVGAKNIALTLAPHMRVIISPYRADSYQPAMFQHYTSLGEQKI